MRFHSCVVGGILCIVRVRQLLESQMSNSNNRPNDRSVSGAEAACAPEPPSPRCPFASGLCPYCCPSRWKPEMPAVPFVVIGHVIAGYFGSLGRPAA